jgi:hypothetical protein
MLGYCSVGRPPRKTTPTMTIKMAITMATMGRLTKKSPIFDHFFCLSVEFASATVGFDGDAVFDLLKTFINHFFTRLESLGDQPVGTDFGSDRDLADLGCVVAFTT